MNEIQEQRLAIANKVLKTLDPLWELKWIEGHGLYFCFHDHSGTPRQKRFSSDDSTLSLCFKLICGGTASRFISLMGRWVQGKPVLPLTVIRQWAAAPYLLWKQPSRRDEALQLLEESDYPKKATCVFCNHELSSTPWDWFCFGKFNGPGCMDDECELRQQTQHSCRRKTA